MTRNFYVLLRGHGDGTDTKKEESAQKTLRLVSAHLFYQSSSNGVSLVPQHEATQVTVLCIQLQTHAALKLNLHYGTAVLRQTPVGKKVLPVITLLQIPTGNAVPTATRNH